MAQEVVTLQVGANGNRWIQKNVARRGSYCPGTIGYSYGSLELVVNAQNLNPKSVPHPLIILHDISEEQLDLLIMKDGWRSV